MNIPVLVRIGTSAEFNASERAIKRGEMVLVGGNLRVFTGDGKCNSAPYVEVNGGGGISDLTITTEAGEIKLHDLETIPIEWKAGADTMTKVFLGRGVTAIGTAAFIGCTSLSEIFWGPNIETIGALAFENAGLVSLPPWPENLSSIGLGAFWQQPTLQGTIELPPPHVTLGEGVFQITGISRAIIPEGFIDLPASTFNSCSQLDTVDILGPGLETIGVGAFGTTKLTALPDFPSTLRNVGQGAFGYNYHLLTALFKEGLLTIGQGVFMECPLLTTIVFPSTLTSVGSYVLGNAQESPSYADQTAYVACPLSVFDNAAFEDSHLVTIYVKAGTAGWTLGADQTIKGKSGITVAEWTSYPELMV